MCYILPGILSVIVLTVIINGLIDDDFKDPWKVCCLWAVGLAAVWFGAYQLQSSIDESRAAERAEKKAYYDRCIIETETYVNNVSVIHTVFNKCGK